MKTEIPKLEYELKLWSQGYDFVIGVDEAGRGPLAGPVVSAALLLKRPSKKLKVESEKSGSFAEHHDLGVLDELLKLDVNDSKKLSAKKREKIFEELKKSEYIKYGIGIVDEKTIDEINILQASLLSMKQAIENLSRPLYKGMTLIVVDGREVVPDLAVSQKAIIGGDGKVFSIAAASIIAKVTRDKIMEEYDKKYPEYLFAKHKGYGTKLHFEMIKKYGVSPIHRSTFL